MRIHGIVLFAGLLAASPALAQNMPGNGGWWWWSGPQQGYGMTPGYGGGPQGGQPWGAGTGMMGDGSGPMMGWRDPNAPGRGRFAMMDANEDGTVTAEEAASQADMVFTSMDADDDGSLTVEEFMSVRMGPQDGLDADRQGAMTARKAARFDPMDTDTNGTVSKAEFIAASKAHFEAADADGDGKTTPWEIRAQNWN